MKRINLALLVLFALCLFSCKNKQIIFDYKRQNFELTSLCIKRYVWDMDTSMINKIIDIELSNNDIKSIVIYYSDHSYIGKYKTKNGVATFNDSTLNPYLNGIKKNFKWVRDLKHEGELIGKLIIEYNTSAKR